MTACDDDVRHVLSSVRAISEAHPLHRQFTLVAINAAARNAHRHSEFRAITLVQWFLRLVEALLLLYDQLLGCAMMQPVDTTVEDLPCIFASKLNLWVEQVRAVLMWKCTEVSAPDIASVIDQFSVLPLAAETAKELKAYCPVLMAIHRLPSGDHIDSWWAFLVHLSQHEDVVSSNELRG